MRIKIISGSVLFALLLTLAFIVSTNLQAKEPDKKHSSTMHSASQYLIEVVHTQESCLKALDEIKDMGPTKLSQWDWGCKHGDHTGYLMVQAVSEKEALNQVPASERDKAKVLPLNKFTTEEIANFHKQMGHK